MELIAVLADVQLQLGGDVILEGRARDVPVRDELMAGDKRITTLIGPPGRVHWCAVDIKGGEEYTTLLSGEHLVLFNKPWAEAPCICERQNSTYHPSAGAEYEQFVERALVDYGFLLPKDIKPISATRHGVQAQLKSKQGARDLPRKGSHVAAPAIPKEPSKTPGKPPRKSDAIHMISQATSTKDLA